MTNRTRYFMAGSTAVIAVGVCTGLVAFYAGGFQALSASTGPTELAYVPADAAVVAYADVRAIMDSDLRQRLKVAIPDQGSGQQEFQAQTGIDIEHDIDTVVAAAGAKGSARGPLILLRGRFDAARIEQLAKDHGATAEQYRGESLLVPDRMPAAMAPDADHGAPGMTFLEPGLLALGDVAQLKAAIDARSSDAGVATNQPLMDLVSGAERSGNAWIVGRFDALADQPSIPSQIRDQLPALEWFVVTANIDRGINGVVRAEARDDQGAEQVRGVLNGALSAARMMAGRDQRVDSFLSGVQTSGSGKTIEVSFAIGPEMLSALKARRPAEAMPAQPPVTVH
jgi:hypothetical protein